VDWWALGIVMYAMLAGRLPFSDTDEYRLHQKIRCHEVEYPEWISLEAILIMRKASIINITTEALQVLEWGYHMLSLFLGHFFFLRTENFCPGGFLKRTQATTECVTEDCGGQVSKPERNATDRSAGEMCGVTNLEIGCMGKCLVVLRVNCRSICVEV
jgi:hypothetical protein